MQQNEIHDRFQTQMLLPDFGREGQEKLLRASVLIIGAGGLGCPCMQYLVGAGVGTIGICDGDVVEISNLHRQILFTSNDLGSKKVVAAKARLEKVFPAIKIITYDIYLDKQMALEIFPGYDIIVDCTDDMQTRFLINDACVLLDKPLVYGAVFQYEGQVAVLNADEEKINLRDIFDVPTVNVGIKSNEMQSCNEYGALGAVTGMVGTMQALETIKLIAGSKDILQNEMLVCNFLTYHHYKIGISKSEKNIPPKTKEEFLLKKYQQACNNSNELNQFYFLQKIKKGNVQVIDVRNENELPKVDFFKNENIPLHELLQHPEKIDKDKTILLFCHAGIRSQTALEFLTEECKLKNVFHLKGGIIKWEKQ